MQASVARTRNPSCPSLLQAQTPHLLALTFSVSANAMVPPHPAPGGANADCQRLLASLVLLGSWICLHLPLPPLWAAEEGGCLSCSHLTLLPLGVPPDSLSCTLPVRALSPFCLDSTTFLHRLSLLPSLNKHGPLVNILATSHPKPSEISFLSFHDKSPLALSPPNLPSAP